MRVELMKLMGDKFKKKRIGLKITQDDAAFAMDLTRVSVCNIEVGKQGFTIETLLSACELFECEPTYFLPTKEEYQPINKNIKDEKIRKLEALLKKLKA